MSIDEGFPSAVMKLKSVLIKDQPRICGGCREKVVLTYGFLAHMSKYFSFTLFIDGLK